MFVILSFVYDGFHPTMSFLFLKLLTIVYQAIFPISLLSETNKRFLKMFLETSRQCTHSVPYFSNLNAYINVPELLSNQFKDLKLLRQPNTKKFARKCVHFFSLSLDTNCRKTQSCWNRQLSYFSIIALFPSFHKLFTRVTLLPFTICS